MSDIKEFENKRKSQVSILKDLLDKKIISKKNINLKNLKKTDDIL